MTAEREIRASVDVQYGPFDFEKYPDDLDTLQRDGISSLTGTTAAVGTKVNTISIDLPITMGRVTVTLTKADAFELARQLEKLAWGGGEYG